MDIIFYKNSSENNRLNKTDYLSDSFTLSGTLRSACSVMTPVIKVQYNNIILEYNYCYIEEFKRYYFITDITAELGINIWSITLTVDVLMSFKSDIVQLSGLGNRCSNSSYQTLYVEDEKYPFNKQMGFVDGYFTPYICQQAQESSCLIITCVSTHDYYGDSDKITPASSNAVFGNPTTGLDPIYSPTTRTFIVSANSALYEEAIEKFIEFLTYIANNSAAASNIIAINAFTINYSLLKLTTDYAIELTGNRTIYLGANDEYSFNFYSGSGDVYTNVYMIKSSGAFSGVLTYGNPRDWTDSLGGSVAVHLPSNFMSVSPYAKVYLRFPYINEYIEVDYRFWGSSNRSLCAGYSIDIISGTINWRLYSVSGTSVALYSSYLITSKSANLTVSIPINYTNYDDTQRQRTANNLNFISSSVSTLTSSVVGVGLGVATMNPVLAGTSLAGGVTGMISNALNYAKANILNVQEATINSGSASQDDFDRTNQYVSFRIVYSNPTISTNTEIAAFNNIMGRPAYKPIALSDLSAGDLISFEEIHIDNISIATTEERNTIYKFLLEGIRM